MKKILVCFLAATTFMLGCATVQSVIKSTFPYTANIVITAGSKPEMAHSVTSTTTSFDQIFGNQNGTDYIKEVRVASARLTASNPTSQNLGIFKSVKLFVSNGTGSEVMVASRNDVSANIGNNIVLDIDNSRFIDDYVKGSNLKIRMEYVLRSSLTSDVSVRAAVNFSSTPNVK